MNRDQLHALDHGYTYGMLWIAGTAVLVGVAALFITYSAADVAHAQKAQAAHDQGLDEDELE
ncbi:integral membrane efflux protein EfpA [Mycobacteroides abscessus subsp. abscessus]|nr:integral membrane efflux protein EfpA [Mycobacteroides abscessus subsp. abscessus]